ncbi:MAG: endonuclease domain-containing protein [Armatimonadia bacterium]
MLAVGLIKWCSRCQTVKKLEAFSGNRAFKDGLNNWCKDCVSAKQKEMAAARGPVLADGLKYCSRCRRELPVDLFRIDRYFPGKRYSYCRECERVRGKSYHLRHKKTMNEKSRRYQASNYHRRKAYLLKRMYGLEKDAYDKMLVSQWGVCAICGRHPGDGRSLHVDHDHETQKVRGLLCGTCNSALGAMLDSPELLEKAATYLRSHREGI